MTTIRVRLAAAALLAAGGLAGCEGGVDGGRVTGTVTLDGVPVSGATVVLVPAAAPDDPAAGHTTTTDAQGRFETRFADPRKGLPPGDYAVTVTKLGPKAGGKAGAEPPDDGQWAAAGGGVNVLPAKYSKPAGSPLRVTVAAGDNDLPLPLQK